MKYYILTLFTLLFALTGCNAKSSSNESKSSHEDTCGTDNAISNQIINVGEISNFEGSFDISQDPEIENEILNGLKFGISEQQYKKDEKKLLSKFEDEDVYGYHIGDFGFHALTPYFLDNKLYRIDINGFNKLNYQDIVNEIQVVKDIYNKKYGVPIFDGRIPKDNELADNQGICIAEWKAGNKTIQLCFFDFTKAAHSNFLKIVIFRSDLMKEKVNRDVIKQEAYSNANTDMI
ncbi:MAG: hypothetical protein K2I64_02355 [Muribaculaceae bacterium]|nr:hypothetical protein [Muribaculaceae bacterium]